MRSLGADRQRCNSACECQRKNLHWDWPRIAERSNHVRLLSHESEKLLVDFLVAQVCLWRIPFSRADKASNKC